MFPTHLAALLLLKQKPINRHALVSRHNVTLTQFDGERPLQVGNGEFAFGMDITGLQTFVPFNTMSQWGWHSSPLPQGAKVSDFQGQVWDTHGRPIRYPMFDPNHPEISSWLAANPHRINLGRIALSLKKKDGSRAVVTDLKNPVQKLDLWTGVVTSRFEFDGQPITVTTACHQTLDSVAVKVESPLVKQGRVSVLFTCPGNNPLQFANFVGDWGEPGHFDEVKSSQSNRADFTRRLDDDVYSMSVLWDGDAKFHRPETGLTSSLEIVSAKYGAADHWLDVTDKARNAVREGKLSLRAGNELGPDPIHGTVKKLKIVYRLNGMEQSAEVGEGETVVIDPVAERRQISLLPGSTDKISFVCAFGAKPLPKALPAAAATFANSCEKWPAYWKAGGAIDLSGSTDPRAKELERRVVLSQYLMKVNEAGSLPPQESGLVNNGWFGRFHLEMTWWHEAHWALWNHWPELNRSIGFYRDLLPVAQARAKSEGYLGARWPKCIGPNFVEWPHEIHSLLLWQQPHPIFFAELDYRAHPTKATLEKWRPIVEATADFLASYAFYDSATKRYVLGPPMVVVSENTNPKETMNPTFELSQWRFGLRTAQLWRQRMGLAKKAEWEKVLRGLSPLPTQDGLYVTYEGIKDMWTKFNFEHPALTGPGGLLPGDGVDRPTMIRTLDKVTQTWDFNHTWGWDFPMLAMCAARSGKPNQAIDFLMTKAPGFQFDERGLATGGPFPYFPSNGGLLYAMAFMCAGWDGAKGSAPGFPKDGKWRVRWENLNVAP